MIGKAKPKFNFENLFILEMANNHKGSLEHARRIVREFAQVVKSAQVRAAVKFQFRHLESLVHPDFLNSDEYEYIPYFQKNRLSEPEYQVLVEEIKQAGLVTMAAPYDEASVDMLDRLGIEVIKVASSYATDWPLLQRVAQSNKPVTVSVGGLNLEEVDKVYSFFTHRGVNFALMHCVAIYPTPNEQLNLQSIAALKNRYPDITVGFSSHEDPNETSNIKVAYALGAKLFERHIGVETKSLKLNAYSSRPHQIRAWLGAFSDVQKMLEEPEKDEDRRQELQELRQFKRGVYLKRFVGQGEKIKRDDVFFAMPLQAGQMAVGEFQNPVVADRSFQAGEAVPVNLTPRALSRKQITYKAIHTVKGMLNEAKVPVNYDADVELSHHYGLENFFEVGALLIDCINREYCKKIIVLLPGQTHPSHYHKKKEEAFQILSGELIADVEGRERRLWPGDTLVIPRGVWHSFRAPEGVIFEEISTTHFDDDSFYEDKQINDLPRAKRKTKLINWGRHQFDDIGEEEINNLEIKPL